MTKKTDKKADTPVTMESLQSQVDALGMEKEALEDNNKKLLAENKSLQAKNKELSTQVDTLQAELSALAKESKPLHKETEEEYLKRRETIKIGGKTYAFKFGTPNKLRVDGKVMTLDKLIKDKKAMEELVIGKVYFVEEVN